MRKKAGVKQVNKASSISAFGTPERALPPATKTLEN